uniref:Uncharacterized protein n=1 Tax=Pelusios castaneus TaxID=367368 RepID=A0A8C8S6V1_9SAUR
MKSGTIFLLLGLLALWTCASKGKSATAKDGECPAAMKGPGRPSQDYCFSDQSCPGSEKCCSDGDRRVCILPDSVHSGYCPKPDPDLISICLVSCSDDTQCSMDEKCCTIGCHRKCTNALPAGPGICPKREVQQTFAPCKNKCEDDRSCPRGQKCCFTGCSLDCVPPLGSAHSTALPPAQSGEGWGWIRPTPEGSSAAVMPENPGKYGTCPPNLIQCLYTQPPLCFNDTDCRGKQKCCYVMCRLRCVDPEQDICQLPAQPGLCDAFSRRYFYNASSQRCEQFLYRGCRGNPNNFRTKAECVQACMGHGKPGECPAVQQRQAGPCEEKCHADHDCPGSQKCCGYGCGSECTSVAPEVRPGVCPALRGAAGGSCEERCRHDSDCPSAQKCCSNGCGLACVAVALFPEVKPGVCPALAPADSLSPCFFRCIKDKDCPGQEKCCRINCGTACLEPKHEKPGLCPALKIRNEGPHLTLCQRDSDCHKREKCCKMGYSFICAPPSPTAGKPGFCPVHNGLYISYECEATCHGDGKCPGAQKCCLRGCDHECLTPSKEKPGICPLTDGLTSESPSSCKSSCMEDKECAGDHKCCASGCGQTCQEPEREKPGTCPKQKPWQTLVPCNEPDACTHDRHCPRLEKCCFAGCAMHCVPPYKEHPGACPRAKVCSDPRQRRSNRCLDDHVCERHEKCCDTGCRRECIAVRPESGAVCPRPQGFGTCVELCFHDEECPRGQKCCSNGCGHVCMAAVSAEKSGTCPPDLAKCRHTAPPECDSDGECPGRKKCCFKTCAMRCVAPEEDAV